MWALAWGYGQCDTQPHYTQIKIAGATVYATTASALADQIRGLQGVKKLAPNQGKLFIYSSPQTMQFWMRHMQIPLDIIWIDQNKKIIYFSEKTPVCRKDPCLLYASEKPAQYILEVNSGFVTAHQLKIGMPVDF